MHPLRVGPYAISRKIGSGGMGNVYLGTHKETGQVAAIKVLPASLAREEGFVLRFNREIEALQKLNSPHIVKLFESGEGEDETYYYAMEYVDGETLTNRLRREKRLPWRDAIQLSLQICAGLKHAHDVGIVHRDLKPSNLMISQDGVLKLTDFGVAQVFAASPLTTTGAIIGTAEYMAPEQVEGRRTDRRSDLYSLGAVIYTMLTGNPPFVGGTAAEIMQRQRFGRFDSPKKYVPDVPLWLDEIVVQLLEKDPEKRYPDAFVVSKRLQEVVNKVALKAGEPISSSESSASDETRVDSPVGKSHEVGPTLMRDLVKSAIEREHLGSPMSRFLNNTWVLLTMLLLVVAFVGWMMQSDNKPKDSTRTEAERIVQECRQMWNGGNAAGAKRRLEALRSMIEGGKEHEQTVKNIDRLLRAIRDREPTFPKAFVTQTLAKADELAEQDLPKAIRIWQGIITIYDGEKTLKELVDEARQRLQEHEETVPPPKPAGAKDESASSEEQAP